MEQVLTDPEVASMTIATPAETHGELVQRALLSGKDMLVEKPLCQSIEEGRRLVGLASETGRVLMVGHLLWYHPAVLRLNELIEEGELGRIQYIYSNRLNLGKIRREEDILWYEFGGPGRNFSNHSCLHGIAKWQRQRSYRINAIKSGLFEK
jgi:UDP-2-acetamido-3-amino-2,3-dideoxy-glucuronate N-acetyltransferase